MNSAFLITLGVRYLLVMLFFPFSALDKILDFKGCVKEARTSVPSNMAHLFIIAGIVVEIVMPLGILTGIADRAAAFIMAGYCMLTALLWKQFWIPGDFWKAGNSKARFLFWDFLKNFSLAGGFLLLVIGAHGSVSSFLAHPLASSQPYTMETSP